MQCAVVLGKLERFDWEVRSRQSLGARYNQLLGGMGITVDQRPDRTSVFAQFTVILNDRQRVQEKLRAAGIPTAVHYPVPLHLQPAYANRCRLASEVTVSERLAKSVMSLPMSADLSEAMQDRIVADVLDAWRS